MISSHPHAKGNTADSLIRCVEKCYACAQACTACADACLGEQMVQQLAQCIRLNLACDDVCAATGSVASWQTGSNQEVIRQMLTAYETARRLCGAGCERACAEALRSMAPH